MLIRLSTFALLLLAPAIAAAATRTATQDGNWADASTWGGAAAPGNADTAVLGIYDVTIATGTTVTVGTSPAPGTDAITIASGGKLILAADATLNLRGDCTVTGASDTYAQAIVLEEGATLSFDASAAGTPSTAIYAIKLGTAYYSYPSIVCNGVTGNHCTITSNAGGANGKITDNTFLGGSIDATYCDFSKLGSSAVKAIELPQYRAAGKFRLQYCTIDDCGRVDSIDADTAATIDLLDVVFTNSTNATESMRLGSSEAKTAGLRTVDQCVFDKTVPFYPPTDFTITNNVFRDGFDTTSAEWDFFTDNLVLLDTVTQIQGYTEDSFFYHTNSGNSNPHYIQFSNGRSMNVRGCLFQHSGSGTDGDCIQMGSPSAAYAYVVTECITLPNSAGNTSGTLVSLGGTANGTISLNHNTYLVTAANTSAAIAETYTGHAGMLASFRSNLAWSDTAAEAEIMHDSGADDAVNDYVTDLGYNGVWNGAATVYALDVANDVANDLTANDVSGNPGFVDKTRDLGAWGATQGGDGTEAGAITILAADPLLIDDMVTWIKAGFVPTNVAFDGTAHDAGDIGAMPYAPAGLVKIFLQLND